MGAIEIPTALFNEVDKEALTYLSQMLGDFSAKQRFIDIGISQKEDVVLIHPNGPEQSFKIRVEKR